MKLRDKLKPFYLQYHNTYGQQTWQGGKIQWGASFHEVTWLFDQVGLVILMCLMRIVSLERKHLSLHRLLV